jgi:hypothetical protein
MTHLSCQRSSSAKKGTPTPALFPIYMRIMLSTIISRICLNKQDITTSWTYSKKAMILSQSWPFCLLLETTPWYLVLVHRNAGASCPCILPPLASGDTRAFALWSFLGLLRYATRPLVIVSPLICHPDACSENLSNIFTDLDHTNHRDLILSSFSLYRSTQTAHEDPLDGGNFPWKSLYRPFSWLSFISPLFFLSVYVFLSSLVLSDSVTRLVSFVLSLSISGSDSSSSVP